MAFTKTVKQMEYQVQITKTFTVPEHTIERVKEVYQQEGMIQAIRELRMRFLDHFNETLDLLDAKNIVEDVKVCGMLTTQKEAPYTYLDQGSSLSDILGAAFRNKNQ